MTAPMEDLATIAERWGTPLYVLDLDQLRLDVTAIAATVAPDRLCYSLKTNYLPAVTDVIRDLGHGVDVVSGYELRAALRAGFDPRRMVFNGPVKTAAELRVAVEAGVFVNIDGEEEIAELSALASARDAVLPVGLRVYPPQDVYGDTSPLPARTMPSKFGWAIAGGDADRMAALVAAQPTLRLSGIHAHLGSQVTNTAGLLEALGSVVDWAAGLPGRDWLTTLNLGGGFGVPGIHRPDGAVAGLSQVRGSGATLDGQPQFDLARLVSGVRSRLRAHDLAVQVVWEPGRAVVSRSMVLLTAVAAVKRTTTASWVLLDGGLNLLPTAGVAELHRYVALRQETRLESFHLAGPLCYEGDIFALHAPLPADIRAGDLVTVQDAGAYGVTRATSFNRPRAGVVAVSGGQARLCWRAETDEDIFGFQEATAR
jgi:diaminopimelate decarboxylase